jgi:hypothetical protein
MDDELYDEFGNYIGPGLQDSSEVRVDRSTDGVTDGGMRS